MASGLVAFSFPTCGVGLVISNRAVCCAEWLSDFALITMVIAIANPSAAQMFFCVKIEVIMAIISWFNFV